MRFPICACTFDPTSVSPMYSADWYRAHRDQHLADFPDSDRTTRDNFEMFIRIAESTKEGTR